MATYQDLINRGGEITNQTTGRVYPNPVELAGDLGIAPHQIDWSQIRTGGTQQPQQPQKPQQVGLSTVLTSMLKNFQKFNSADRYTQLYKQNRELQEAQGMRSISPVGGSATLSPSQRATIRGGSAAALGSQVTASADVIKGKQAAATQFLNAINVARGLGKDMEDLKTQQEEKAMEGLKLLAYSDSPISQAEISQVASLTGYDVGALTGYVAELQRQAQGQKTLDDLELALKRKDLSGAGTLTTSVVEVDGQKVLINSKTGDTIKVLGSVGIDQNTLVERLQAQNLSSTMVNKDGTLTEVNKNNLVEAGMNADDADIIMGWIIQGYSLEEIRTELRAQGEDPQILDTFMKTLQY